MTANIRFLKEVETKLKQADVLSPRAEAETMLRHFGRLDRLRLFTDGKPLTHAAKRSIARALQKRRRGVPLAHLVGQAPFFGRSFFVTPDVLIPRPETERLVEEALRTLNTHYAGETPDVLDLGTGTGCIAASLTLQGPPCRMTALDASEKALGVARKNLKLFGLDKKIRLVQSRLFERFGAKKALWDVIVSNPPYVPSGEWRRLSREVRNEPRLALDGGAEGLDVIEAILNEAPRFLKRGGWLLVEIGQAQRKKIAERWVARPEYESLRFDKDLNGSERIVIARRRAYRRRSNLSCRLGCFTACGGSQRRHRDFHG